MLKVIQQWQGTIAQAEAMMQQQAMMMGGPNQAPPEKQKPEPSQGREKAAKGQNQ